MLVEHTEVEGRDLYWVETIQYCPTCGKQVSITQAGVDVTTERGVLSTILPFATCDHCHSQELFGFWPELLKWMDVQIPALALEEVLEFGFDQHSLETWVWLQKSEAPIRWAALVDALDENLSALAYAELHRRITCGHGETQEASMTTDWVSP
jgi:hypothetical protein